MDLLAYQLFYSSNLSIYRWNKLIQRPYENGDPRGLRLIKAILRPLMLRRTKESKDKEGRWLSCILSFSLLLLSFSPPKSYVRNLMSNNREIRPILVLPPTDVQIIECAQSEAERDFYDALFKRSKVNYVFLYFSPWHSLLQLLNLTSLLQNFVFV